MLDAQAAAASFTLENGQTYQIPQYQIYTPIYQRIINAQQGSMMMSSPAPNGSVSQQQQQQAQTNEELV